jgi:hypothetical protein
LSVGDEAVIMLDVIDIAAHLSRGVWGAFGG